VPKVNYLENIGQMNLILSSDDLKEINAKPRPEPIPIEEEERPKSPWTLQKSIFASY
jgi:hypothetical protein